MDIQVIDAELTKAEPEFFAAVMATAARHTHRAKEIKVFCAARIPDDAPPYKNPQWLEYSISISYEDGGKLFIGAIQRTKGATVEFHS